MEDGGGSLDHPEDDASTGDTYIAPVGIRRFGFTEHQGTLRKEGVQTLTVVYNVIQVTVVNGDRNIQTGGGAFNVNGPVVLGDENEVTSTTLIGPSSALDQELGKLSCLIGELAKHLPAAQAAEALDNLETLKKEASKESPRQKWYELSASGLVDAAKTVASMAPGISASVAAVLKILNGSISS